MTIEDDIAFLERVPTLHLLSRQALRILAIGAQSRYVHGGEILFNAGEEAEGGYVVQEGSFNLMPESSAGRAANSCDILQQSRPRKNARPARDFCRKVRPQVTYRLGCINRNEYRTLFWQPI